MLNGRNITANELCTYVLGARCGAAIWADWEVQLPDTPKPPHVDPVLPDVSGEEDVRQLTV